MADDLDTLVPNKPLFWPSEAAAILGVSIPTVYRWIESGVLLTHLTRKPYKIRRQVIIKFLSQDSQE